jgi:hypothetical protein
MIMTFGYVIKQKYIITDFLQFSSTHAIIKSTLFFLPSITHYSIAFYITQIFMQFFLTDHFLITLHTLALIKKEENIDLTCEDNENIMLKRLHIISNE